MIFLLLFLALLLLYCLFFAVQFYYIVFKGYAPFVSTDQNSLRMILAEIEIISGLSVYELGCGRALFLRQAEKLLPNSKLTGVENSPVIYWLNLWYLRLRRSHITLLRKDFFQINLADADIIYCYLNHATMSRLADKIKIECRPGTIIISRRFYMPGFLSEKTIVSGQHKVYFYRV
jgi:hypothetical protein